MLFLSGFSAKAITSTCRLSLTGSQNSNRGEFRPPFSLEIGIEWPESLRIGPTLMRESPLNTPVNTSASLRVIAVAIVFTGCYFASSVIITLICAIFIAFVLAPGVAVAERIKLPRWFGAILMVLMAISILSLLAVFLYGRVVEFLEDVPVLGARIQEIVVGILKHLERLELRTEALFPRQTSPLPTVRVESESGWTQYVFRGIGSIYTASVTVMFIPFLVFFMLTSKGPALEGNAKPVPTRAATCGRACNSGN